VVRGEQGALEVAINLPYYVRPGDIYSQIMGQQQAAPRTLADYYPGFTGGYDTSLYAPKRQIGGDGGQVGGLLDIGGGMGDGSAMGGTDYGLGLIGLGQGLSSLGLTGLGGMIGNIGIGQLGAAEADAAAQAAAAESMAAVAADQAAAAADMNAAANAAADAAAAAGGAAAGAAAGDGLGYGSGGWGGEGDGAGGYYAKGGKVTMRGLLVDKTLPGPDDGYAALQAGEYVIKKSTTKKLGDKKLQALNEGRASIKMRKE
jgi:hypothetical protein